MIKILKMERLKIYLISCIILFFIQINAQEISVLTNVGLQGLNYKVTNGDNELKIGGKIGIGYSYFINKNWALLAGFEVGSFGNDSKLLDNTFTSNQIDSEGDAFEYRVKTVGYKEKSNFYAANIPLMLQYRTAGATQFYINGGGRVFFPFHQKTKVSIEEVKLSGYYSDMNVELIDMPSHGFSTLTNWKSSNETKLKTSFALSTEIGLSFLLSEKIRLYTGLYLDYGLNNMVKTNEQVTDLPLLNYDENSNNKANGLIGTTNAVDQTKLLAYGIQFRLGFGSWKNKPKSIIEEIVVIDEQFIEVREEKTTQAIEKLKKIEEVEPINFKEKQLIEEPLVFGGLGKVELTPLLINHLNQISILLERDSEQGISIIGHTCDIGNKARNQEVGLQRANIVADYLETKGINKNRLFIESQGEEFPLCPNTSEINRQRNRRVEIKLR